MNSLMNFLEEIYTNTTKKPSFSLYRGIQNKEFKLEPGLFRKDITKNKSAEDMYKLEGNLFSQYISLGSLLLDRSLPRDGINILIQMQHSGAPTRLLDWTDSLFVALFFALRNYKDGDSPTIWILDPFTLNDKSIGDEVPESSFIRYNPDNKEKVVGIVKGSNSNLTNEADIITIDTPVAFVPPTLSPRMLAQNSFFTIHGTNRLPLEQQLCIDCIKAFQIPTEIIPNIRTLLLNFSSINEYTMFPDLDGLARYLKQSIV